jgi:hypothetical protein
MSDKKTAEAEEDARLAEVNRKLAALEQEDDTLKSLRKSPAKPKPSNDSYDSIDEISEADSVSSDDGLSVGGAEDSASDSFLESDSRGYMPDTSRGSATRSIGSRGTAPGPAGGGGGGGGGGARGTGSTSGNLASSSIEFSVTEHDISGSQASLDDVDFSAKALPPVRGTKPKSGW